jgi:hypothetical protein
MTAYSYYRPVSERHQTYNTPLLIRIFITGNIGLDGIREWLIWVGEGLCFPVHLLACDSYSFGLRECFDRERRPCSGWGEEGVFEEEAFRLVDCGQAVSLDNAERMKEASL